MSLSYSFIISTVNGSVCRYPIRQFIAETRQTYNPIGSRVRIAVFCSSRIDGSSFPIRIKQEKEDLRKQRKEWRREGDERPVDQTESNNSRGITTLAHGNRSYSRGDSGCETRGRKSEMGERKRRREQLQFGKVVSLIRRKGRRLEVGSFLLCGHNGDDDILSSSIRM